MRCGTAPAVPRRTAAGSIGRATRPAVSPKNRTCLRWRNNITQRAENPGGVRHLPEFASEGRSWGRPCADPEARKPPRLQHGLKDETAYPACVPGPSLSDIPRCRTKAEPPCAVNVWLVTTGRPSGRPLRANGRPLPSRRTNHADWQS